ncbi:1-deoxy-D-xylulose-5-phosphate reductoisomerase [Oscillibacter sp.]|uniref:1-deoxy-D-xylulose-5-phosphate reductoisomerase n=1 Tax=Oscillibacter sp. TaxID=1945593 RepID=UPI0028AAE426|nr:1-deoxy-D-xylulose-5-phosphate reductoisomerase [Oscillibacter sp.]
MTKTISLLGSTGSIGRQTLDVAGQLNLSVVALAARGGNLELLERQTRQFLPRLVALYDSAAAEEFRSRVGDLNITIVSGPEGLLEAATIDGADTVVAAVVGMVGLGPTLAAIEQGKRIALANKETLVCAGELVMDAADRYGAEIVPVDSEHSAIFQCLRGCEDRREVKRLLLTCSGGPFYEKSFAELEGMTKQDALRHPNWKMGPKITVDCATLMNKGLEVIEAMRLYRLPLGQVDVLIHRQSIVHSLVEYRDGAVLAQLGTADMRLPIRYAFTYPRRGENPAEPLDLLSSPPLTFAAPDREAFPCFALAEAAAETGGTACAVLNGANEAAVSLFLQEKIGFNDIPRLVKKAREVVPVVYHPTLSDILKADTDARRAVFPQ